MTRTFVCEVCVPSCRLETDEEDVSSPITCPWGAVGEAKWTEVEP